MSIKILDASILLTGTDAQKSAFCEALVDGFSNQGMVKLVNHGLPNSKIQGIFDWVWLTALHSSSETLGSLRHIVEAILPNPK